MASVRTDQASIFMLVSNQMSYVLHSFNSSRRLLRVRANKSKNFFFLHIRAIILIGIEKRALRLSRRSCPPANFRKPSNPQHRVHPAHVSDMSTPPAGRSDPECSLNTISRRDRVHQIQGSDTPRSAYASPAGSPREDTGSAICFAKCGIPSDLGV